MAISLTIVSIHGSESELIAEPQRIDVGVEDSDHHLATVFITRINYGDSSSGGADLSTTLLNVGYEPVDITDWYLKTIDGVILNLRDEENPIPPCGEDSYVVFRTDAGRYSGPQQQFTLYDENDNKIDQTDIINGDRAPAAPTACAGTAYTDTVWISEIETNPATLDDRGREWVTLTNGQNKDVYLKDWSLIGTVSTYPIVEDIKIEPCDSVILQLGDITIENEDERLLLADEDNQLVDRTPYFTDTDNDGKTIKYEPPKCADSLEDITIPDPHSLSAKVDELERLVSMLLSKAATSGSSPIITTGVSGTANTEFGTVVAISTSDFSKQVLSPVVDGTYGITLDPGEYLIQLIGSNSYETITVYEGQVQTLNLN